MLAVAERDLTIRPATLRSAEGMQKPLDENMYKHTLDRTSFPHIQATIDQWFEKNVGLEGNNT